MLYAVFIVITMRRVDLSGWVRGIFKKTPDNCLGIFSLNFIQRFSNLCLSLLFIFYFFI